MTSRHCFLLGFLFSPRGSVTLQNNTQRERGSLHKYFLNGLGFCLMGPNSCANWLIYPKLKIKGCFYR
jgi:hypothetical protein